jgi:hypothetical protein
MLVIIFNSAMVKLGSKGVEYLTHNSKIEDLNPALALG